MPGQARGRQTSSSAQSRTTEARSGLVTLFYLHMALPTYRIIALSPNLRFGMSPYLLMPCALLYVLMPCALSYVLIPCALLYLLTPYLLNALSPCLLVPLSTHLAQAKLALFDEIMSDEEADSLFGSITIALLRSSFLRWCRQGGEGCCLDSWSLRR